MHASTHSLEWLSSGSTLARFESAESARNFARDTQYKILWELGDREMLIFGLPSEDRVTPKRCESLKPVQVIQVTSKNEKEQERLCRKGAEIWQFSSLFNGLMLGIFR